MQDNSNNETNGQDIDSNQPRAAHVAAFTKVAGIGNGKSPVIVDGGSVAVTLSDGQSFIRKDFSPLVVVGVVVVVVVVRVAIAIAVATVVVASSTLTVVRSIVPIIAVLVICAFADIVVPHVLTGNAAIIITLTGNVVRVVRSGRAHPIGKVRQNGVRCRLSFVHGSHHLGDGMWSTLLLMLLWLTPLQLTN